MGSFDQAVRTGVWERTAAPTIRLSAVKGVSPSIARALLERAIGGP
jgi:hypothetical protein